ncbi:MAG TPA: methylated-DNA--[protein]-cysteine S-methyltransferase, partial [Steroidobacteraceae bacterium]|nr:methylated-DNA--[protein]-cysteine S-methyltransferase [Steroidobacteraceae bacterium]
MRHATNSITALPAPLVSRASRAAGSAAGAETAFLTHRDFRRIACAIGYIDTNFRAQPRLADIAADVGLSEFHFNRLFKRWAGLTPKQYLALVTHEAALDALGSAPAVLDAAYDVGLSGAGRLHDLTVTMEALTPGEIRKRGADVTIRYGVTASPFGATLIAATERGVCHLAFVDSPGFAATQRLAQAWPGARLVRDDPNAAQMAHRIWPRTAQAAPPLALAVAGTNFQVQVWRALLALDGMTTYGELAARLGMPGAARAVGNAVGANPIAWIIPCHRVLRGDGSLGGYRWGIDRKRAVLVW